jgi:hypothetical protein
VSDVKCGSFNLGTLFVNADDCLADVSLGKIVINRDIP